MSLRPAPSTVALSVCLLACFAASPAYAQCTNFTDPSLAAGSAIKAVHITELRACIDAKRAVASLGNYSWTDPTITPGVTLIRAVHLTEMRIALSAAYSALTLSAPTFTDGTVVAEVSVVRAVHIVELRAAGAAAPSSAPGGGGSGGGGSGGGGGGCSYAVDPVSLAVDSTNQNIELTVDTQEGCPWTAVSNNSFVQVSSGATGLGPATVMLFIENNTSTSLREGSADIAGRVVSISQDGVVPNVPEEPPPAEECTASVQSVPTEGMTEVSSSAACESNLSSSGDPVPAASGTMVTILVHGSFNSNPPWIQTGSAEFNAIAETFGQTPLQFRWTNVNAVKWPSYQGILDGATEMADYIDALGLPADATINVVTHSHGGNVARIAAYLLAKPFDRLINLATPVNRDLWVPGPYARKYCQVSSYIDSTQFFGAAPFPQQYSYFFHQSQFAYNLAKALEARLNGEWDLEWYYTSVAAWHEVKAQGWWFSTKLQPGARNFMFWGFQGHDAMHEPPVWNAIKNQCAVN